MAEGCDAACGSLHLPRTTHVRLHEHKRQRGALPDLHKNPAATGIYERSTEVKRWVV
jgi:hypothetical protein